MGGHGHGHHEPYTIPDYKIYKVENVPKLMAVKRALAGQGLRDPWLRNEVWRFQEKEFGSEVFRIKSTFLRGFTYGLAACVVTVIATSIYDTVFAKKKHHGQHGHGDH